MTTGQERKKEAIVADSAGRGAFPGAQLMTLDDCARFAQVMHRASGEQWMHTIT